MDKQISFQFGIYYLPQPTKDPLAELDALLAYTFTAIHRVDTIDQESTRPTVSARLDADPKNNYPPPDRSLLRYFGYGLTPQQVDELQKTQSVLVLDFAHPKAHVWDGLREAVKLAHSLAQSTGGLIFDGATAELFSPEEWEQRRIEGWHDLVPNVGSHTVIHAYQKGEYLREISSGCQSSDCRIL